MVDQAISLPHTKNENKKPENILWQVDCRQRCLHYYELEVAQHGCVAEWELVRTEVSFCSNAL